MNGNTPEQQNRQDALVREGMVIVDGLFRAAEKHTDFLDRSYLLAGVALSTLYAVHGEWARHGTRASDEWLTEQLRGLGAMLSTPERRITISMSAEPAVPGR